MLPSPVRRTVSPAHLHMQKWRGRIGMSLAAALSVLAGMTDAIGFMATGDFVSFMSGNTTRLAVAISDADIGTTARLSLAIATFVLGNALGIVVARLGGRRALPLLLSIGMLLCVAAAWPLDSRIGTVVAAILAMGMLNAAVEQVNGLPVGLTYVTGALSRFGRGFGRWMLGEHRDGWRVQLVPWTGMFIGAVIGAILEQRMGLNAMLICGMLAALLGLLSLKIPHRWQRRYMPR
ncbi:YoaK family protein [Pseudomonas sp. DWP3-1-2]|uniref:YoaK family protein n=1 Tax=Pseudomonas sp. DWP3-1-2 TaxID=2804645 RepID=UPI003CE98379